jgi:glycerate kinase
MVACDKFGGALSAAEAAAAIAEGLRRARPGAEIRLCPLGDGGEGTGAILAEALNAAPRTRVVRDPLGRPVEAIWWLCEPSRTGVVEMAAASGLWRLAPGERDPLRATSFGTGELLKAAAEAGCRKILLAVGGSATVDGGAGCLQALGWELLDGRGEPLAAPAGAAGLTAVHRVRPPRERMALDLTVLCDVDNVLLGPRGAAAVFAPQKGAAPRQIPMLERGLARWAEVLRAAGGREVRGLAGSGAAGGLPAALAALLDAKLVSGFDCVARAMRLSERLAGCHLCLTGEGRLDEQTRSGKVVAGVARMAAAVGVPVVALVGAVRPPEGVGADALAAGLGLAEVVVVTPPGLDESAALAGTRDNLRVAAESFARRWRRLDR